MNGYTLTGDNLVVSIVVYIPKERILSFKNMPHFRRVVFPVLKRTLSE